MERLVKIDCDGNLTFLYDDKMPWRDLGEMKCERASDVVFDGPTQKWVIRIPYKFGSSQIYKTMGFFDSREEAIEREIEILETRMEAENG